MSLLKIPYELSLWEDRLTIVDSDLNEYDTSVPEGKKVIATYFKEIKICVIGANDLESPIKAINPNLVKNVDGTNTLTFSIYGKYYDEESEEFIPNPYLPYLVNERKVKLKTIENGEIVWRDFIIKNVQEESVDYRFTYTAKDLFINELSKSGYSLEFDTELKNNMGSISYLADKVLDGSGWTLSPDSEELQELQEEALYEVVLNTNLLAYNTKDNSEITIPAGENIFVFYNSINNFDPTFFQFIYREGGKNSYITDDDRLITNADNYYAILNTDWENIAENFSYTPDFRGTRPVRSQITFYDPILERQVNVYSNEKNAKVYGFSEVECITEQLAQNYITNGEYFISTAGWKQKNDETLDFAIIPSWKENPDVNTQRIATLKYEQTEDNFLYNSGIKDNAQVIKQIVANEEFMFRAKMHLKGTDQLLSPVCQIKIQLKSYRYSQDGFEVDTKDTKIVLEGTTSLEKDPDGFFITRVPLKAKMTITEEELSTSNFGIFITVVDESGKNALDTYYFEEIQFFRYYVDKNFNVFLPGGNKINLNQEPEQIHSQVFVDVEKKYYFYYPQNVKDKAEVEYIYVGPEEKYRKRYNHNYGKVRSITASESNRFNLLQQLAEIFQCWCRFEVNHKPTGEIELWKDYSERTNIIDAGSFNSIENDEYDAGNSNIKETNMVISDAKEIILAYRQRKLVSFHPRVGQFSKSDGFKYGINLKKIQRDVASDEVVTKLIVKNNNNEFAENGFCSISRAKDNTTGENFLLNLDYYIQNGLLNGENFYNDLYNLNQNMGWIGYYPRLKEYNNEIQSLNLELTTKLGELDRVAADFEFYQVQSDESSKLLKEKKEYFQKLTSQPYDLMLLDDPWMQNKEASILREEIYRLIEEDDRIRKELNNTLLRKQAYDTDIRKLTRNISKKIAKKNNLIDDFERKYSRFIQEGSWNSEDYIDDNLYYLDAESTLYNSAKSKVEYTINVVELSQWEEYQNYTFCVGDITWIQDPDFFGWIWIDGEKTPYKEKIVVTEISTYFDNPEQSTIKVSNYNSQFDDLFQRYTAAVQKIETHSGEYAKAASVIDSNGTITSKALEAAFANNTNVLKNAANQSVVWDDTGITTSSFSNGAEKVRITSGGIFLTNDGGNTWTTGITGDGINAKVITTGQLNTNNITILNGDAPSFRWDANGINAYFKEEVELNDGTKKQAYNNKTFVRFDQYGLYGVKDSDGTFVPQNEEEVWDKASFALTWKGFKLQSSSNRGSIQIDSENDFNILDGYGRELIRIGRLDSLTQTDFDSPYGIRIRDENGAECFLATPDGLIAGGWSVTPQGLYCLNMAQGEEYSVGLYSKPLKSSMSVAGSGDKKEWRFVAGEGFGVDFNGNLYSSNCMVKKLNVSDCNRIVFFEKDSTASITFSQYGIERKKTGSDGETKLITWEQLFSKLA